MKYLCVFCGSSSGVDGKYRQAAKDFGYLLVEKGLHLVFGGGHIGLMGTVADAVLEKGGEVIGVIPQALKDKELAHSGITKMHVVDTMHQRKALMADIADGFVALPGGFGTGDEFFEIVTWAQLGIHNKPIGILNVRDYFGPMLQWINQMVGEGFVRSSHRELILVSDEPNELIGKLLRREPDEPEMKWKTI